MSKQLEGGKRAEEVWSKESMGFYRLGFGTYT